MSIDHDSKLNLTGDALTDELQWLCFVVEALNDKNLIAPGWSRYYANCKRKPIDPPGINTILTLLRESSHIEYASALYVSNYKLSQCFE